MSNLKKIIRSPLSFSQTRRNSTPRGSQFSDTGELYKAFTGFQQDILAMQFYIEKQKGILFPDRSLRGTHKRRLPPTARMLDSLQGQTAVSLQQQRNSILTESIIQLLGQSLGTQYSSLQQETALRLLVLKSKFQQISQRKIAQILVLWLFRIGIEASDLKIVQNLLKVGEIMDQQTPFQVSSQELKSQIGILEQQVSEKSQLIEKMEKSMVAKEEFKNCQEIIKKKQEEIFSLKEQNQVLSKKNLECERVRDKLKVDLSRFQQEFSQINQKINQQTQENSTKFKAEIKELTQKLKQTEELLSQEKSLNQKLSTQISLLSQQKQTMSHQIQQKQVSSSALWAQKLQLELKIHQLSSSNSLLQQSLSKIQQQSVLQSIQSQQQKSKLKALLQSSQQMLQKQVQATQKLEKKLEAPLRFQASIQQSKHHQKLLQSQVTNLKKQIDSVQEQLQNKTQQCQSLNTQLRSLIIQLNHLHHTNDRLQAQLESHYEEDTFQNVMRYQITMMKEAYQRKITLLKDDTDKSRKKLLQEIKALKSQVREAQHSRDMAEFRLKATKN